MNKMSLLSRISAAVIMTGVMSLTHEAHSDDIVDMVNFGGDDGYYPGTSPNDADGILYGIASKEGARGDGVAPRPRRASEAPMPRARHNGRGDWGLVTGLTDVPGAFYRTPHERDDDGYGAVSSFSPDTLNLMPSPHKGDANSYGAIFPFNPSMLALMPLSSFNEADGFGPTAGLTSIFAVLYGVSREGDAGRHGAVFFLDQGALALTSLAGFDWADSSNLTAGLSDIFDALCGADYGGDTGDGATVYQVSPSSSSQTASSVPEPSSLFALASGVLLLLAVLPFARKRATKPRCFVRAEESGAVRAQPDGCVGLPVSTTPSGATPGMWL
jgi:hypothetical protein